LNDLRVKLAQCDTDVRNFLVALDSENLRLQKQVAKLQAALVSANNRIKVLEELHPEGAIQTLTDEELEARLGDVNSSGE
jgi:predicted  nucleic acid-binding Zn-ribbon protein